MLLICLALMVSPPAKARTYHIESKARGYVYTQNYPTGDFQIQLKVNLSAPGSVLDTVGIDAAPVGSWSLLASPDGHFTFNLWDGSSWSALTCDQPFKFNEDELITIRRVSGTLLVRVGTASVWAQRTTPLSGAPIYVGDYLPDEHWGSGYNIHQAALGSVSVLYCGPPRLFHEPFSDYESRIYDPQRELSGAQRHAVAQSLRDLKERKGIAAVAGFLNVTEADAGYRVMTGFIHTLLAEGKLPEEYASFACAKPRLRLYQRTSATDKIITWNEIKPVWSRIAKDNPPADAVALTLSEIAGTAGLATVTGPTPTGLVSAAEGKAEIGDEGGAVKSGEVTVEVPPGAMVKPDNLVVKQGVDTIFGVNGVAINFEHGPQTLSKPGTIRFRIPAGADTTKLVVLRSLSKNAWITLPTKVDSAAGTVSATTNHFCDSVLLDYGRLNVKIASAVGGGVTGTIILAAVGAAPTTSGVSVLVAIPFVATGWLLGGAAYENAQKEGLVGPYELPGFSIFWDPQKVPSGPYLVALVDGRNGNLITFTKDSRANEPPTIGPATGTPRNTLTYEHGGYTLMVDASDLRELNVPISVLGVASELNQAKTFYNYLGVQTPESTTVYIYDRVGKSKDAEKAVNSGLWDGTVLGINAKSLNPEPPNSADSRSASSHEYWHAVYGYNHFKEVWIGTEEASAVALESLVWSSPKGTPPDQLMQDFMSLHSWTECSSVFRSGLNRVGPDETADSRGYKQWPLIKYVYHKYGKDAFIDLIQGKMSRQKLDEVVLGFALAGFISDEVIPDPAPFPDHPAVADAITNTGFKGKVLVQDPEAKNAVFGENSKPKSAEGAINAYRVEVPDRTTGAPPCPIIVRRHQTSPDEYPVLERVFASRPSASAVLQPKLADVKTGEYAVALPPDWDQGSGHMAFMLVGSTATAPKEDTGSDNPLMVYRLEPPLGVEAEHLQASTEENSKSRFTWKTPHLGAGLTPGSAIAAYRLYGRKSGGSPELLAEIALDNPSAPKGWYTASESAVHIDPGADTADVLIPRSKVIGYDEFAMSSVDGLMREQGQPLESPIGWAGGTDLLGAFAKCDSVSFSASVSFEATTTINRPDAAPEVTTSTYPMTGGVVNPPDVWGFSSAELKTGKLTINGGKFEFRYSGDLKQKGESAGSLMEALSGHTAAWPFNAGSAFDGPTSVTLSGQIGADGRLLSAVLNIEHAQFGCAMYFGDLAPSVAKIDGNNVTIAYQPNEAEATAKSRGHSTWMRWIYTNGSQEFRMTRYIATRGINLTFTKKR